jgi:hypothetical protein
MLVKAKLIHLGTLEELAVLWNPESYRVEVQNRVASPSVLGSIARGTTDGRADRFWTRLFLDSTERLGGERDLEHHVERLERWAEPAADGLPPLLFVWGSFRFRGVVEELRREWILFDRDGTPTRGWVDLSLRGSA